MRFYCPCGETLSNTQAPNDVELTIYTDQEWDEIMNMGDMIDPISIPLPKYTVFQCTNCERIHFFEGYELIKSYVLEYKR